MAQAREEAALECDDGTVPLIVFIGDGVSDLPAARQADVLFARKGLRLEEYCVENRIPYLGFDTFGDIKVEIEKIMEEDERATKGKGMPKRANPRANIVSQVPFIPHPSTIPVVHNFPSPFTTSLKTFIR